MIESALAIHETECNTHFMNETNSSWDDLRLFLSVARHQGLAGAARETGKSAATLGRRMLAFEQATGAELFDRGPRGYTLTDAGAEFLTRAQAIEAQITPLVDHGRDTVPLVKISAGSWMTSWLCTQASHLLDARAPVRLRFIAADHHLDIARREAVIGIRNTRPDQVGLACQRVGKVRFAVYATGPDVNAWAQVTGQTPSALWLRSNHGGAEGIEVTTPRNALDLARAGIARAVLPTFIGEAEGGLVQVTGTIEDLTHDQWLVTHHDARFTKPVRQTLGKMNKLLTALHAKG